MCKQRECAHNNYKLLQSYSPEQSKYIAKAARKRMPSQIPYNGVDKAEKKAIIDLMIEIGLADEDAAGHASKKGKTDKGQQGLTKQFQQKVTEAMRNHNIN